MAALSAMANGDPVAIYSALTLSPTPVAKHVPEVQLVDEFVTFTPNDRYMDVTVRYLLHNNSKRSFDKLPYGFPIDYFGSGPAGWDFRDMFSESMMEVGWRDSYIRNVCFTLNDRQLPWQCSRDTIIVPEKKTLFMDYFIEIKPDSADTYSHHIIDSLYKMYGEDIYEYSQPISRRWYYTYLNIPAQSYVMLEVRYTVECTFRTGLYERKNNLISHSNNYFGHLQFQYDFTPAAYWGNGHANHFQATFDASKIVWSRVPGEEELGISGLPMKAKNKLWHYETHDFNFASAKPFSVEYFFPTPLHQPLDRLLSHCVPASEYTIQVSGADKKYPASNLCDLDPATTTVLKADKNDSIYITIRFKKPTALEGMILVNGYTKNAETYRNNARIDSLMVFGNYFSVHTIGDESDTAYNNKPVMLFGERDWIVKYTDFRPLPAKYDGLNPTSFDWQSIVDNSMLLGLSHYGTNYFTEINIVITAATKGLKYNDLCVSEILLITP